jgi:predicted nucleic acid-binding protein
VTVLLDSSVWIDLFADRQTLQTELGRRLIGRAERVVVGDLVLTEVLQGTRGPQDFKLKLARLAMFDQVAIMDQHVAAQAARNYQHLRALGVTIRKTIDTLIATRCILDDFALLYSDRDFDPFVQHLGLRSALDGPGDHHA